MTFGFETIGDSEAYSRQHWGHWVKLELIHEPSYYVRNHFVWGVQDDFLAIRLRDAIGFKNIMWGADFPPVATNWPESRKLIETVLGSLPEYSVID